MKRRAFLKILSAAPVAAASPALAKTDERGIKFKSAKNPYYEGEIRKYKHSPITKELRVALEGDSYTGEQVRQLIGEINKEINVGDKITFSGVDHIYTVKEKA